MIVRAHQPRYRTRRDQLGQAQSDAEPAETSRDANCILAGTTLRQLVSSHARRLGVTGNVFRAGHCCHSRLLAVYRADLTDCSVLPIAPSTSGAVSSPLRMLSARSVRFSLAVVSSFNVSCNSASTSSWPSISASAQALLYAAIS